MYPAVVFHSITCCVALFNWD